MLRVVQNHIYIRCTYGIFGREITKYLGLARTIFTRCIYGIFGREITKYTVIYGVHIRLWPTLQIYGRTRCICMVLANPNHAPFVLMGLLCSQKCTACISSSSYPCGARGAWVNGYCHCYHAPFVLMGLLCSQKCTACISSSGYPRGARGAWAN